MDAKEVRPDELQAAIDLIRSGKQAPLRFRTAAEVLQAAQLGIIDKKEARRLLGLTRRRQPKQLREARLRVQGKG
jgi:hypothetical protein